MFGVASSQDRFAAWLNSARHIMGFSASDKGFTYKPKGLVCNGCSVILPRRCHIEINS